MSKKTFVELQAECKAEGLTLERDRLDGHPYCLWVNSPTGSKEIWCRNFEEVETARVELRKIMEGEGSNCQPAPAPKPWPEWDVKTDSGYAGGDSREAMVHLTIKTKADLVEEIRAKVEALPELIAACSDYLDARRRTGCHGSGEPEGVKAMRETLDRIGVTS